MLKADMTAEDWEKLLLNCFKWQRVLIEESSDDLVPMVTVLEVSAVPQCSKSKLWSS